MVVSSNVINPQGLEPLQFPTKFRSHSLLVRVQRDLKLEAVVVAKYAAVAPVLDERSRRVWAAAESLALGYGGDAIVWRWCTDPAPSVSHDRPPGHRGDSRRMIAT